MLSWVRALLRSIVPVVIGVIFVVRGNLGGRLTGIALLALAAFFLWRTFLDYRTRYRANEVGECPWCRGDLPAQSTVCPHCHQEVSPLYRSK
jgi:hypothetical protein